MPMGSRPCQADSVLIFSQKMSRYCITPFSSVGGGVSTIRLPSNLTLRTWSLPTALRADADASTLVIRVVPSKV